MQTFRFGAVKVDVCDGFTVTHFDDGAKVWAIHAPQPGQELTAAHIGCSVEEMNREHDPMHSRVAYMLNLPHSPALWALAHGLPKTPLHEAEEQAVIALQRFAVMAMSISVQ